MRGSPRLRQRALRLLRRLTTARDGVALAAHGGLDPVAGPHGWPSATPAEIRNLVASGLARIVGGRLYPGEGLGSHVARADAVALPFLAQHGHVRVEEPENETDRPRLIDDAESPLAWLARRSGRDGRSLIAAHQFAAGERLRADFTLARMTPRTTVDWASPPGRSRQGPRDPAAYADTVIAARERMRRAIEAVGPELSGLLLDVCCFLKGLSTVEQERGWPARSAKVVLEIGLDRLARHYGLGSIAIGPDRARARAFKRAPASPSAGAKP